MNKPKLITKIVRIKIQHYTCNIPDHSHQTRQAAENCMQVRSGKTKTVFWTEQRFMDYAKRILFDGVTMTSIGKEIGRTGNCIRLGMRSAAYDRNKRLGDGRYIYDMDTKDMIDFAYNLPERIIEKDLIPFLQKHDLCDLTAGH